MFVLNCGLCRPEREGEGVAASGSSAAAEAPPLAHPSQQQGLSRSKSELRVLRMGAGDHPQFYRSQSMPVGLLAASRRRMQEAEQREAATAREQQAAMDGAAAVEFVRMYMAAIKEGNASWASDPAVGDLFLEDARMVAVDRQIYNGKTGIVRRLNDGVAQLARMAGGQDEAQLPTFELEGPTSGAGGTLVLSLKLRRGLQRMTFTLTFTMRQGRIAVLQNTRS